MFWVVWLACSLVLGQASLQINKNTCTPSSAGSESVDDVPAISEALATCGNGGTIVIPAGKTFMIRSTLNFGNCSGCDFQIEGTLKLSDDVVYWQDKRAGFLVENMTGVIFHSLTGSGLIDGSGQKFWDHFAINQTLRRPLLVDISGSSNIIFTLLQLINAPMFFFVTNRNSTNITLSYLSLSAVSTSENRPANTDGFDPGDSSYVTIANNYVRNGDDCVAFKPGSSYITVDNITCIGSHGLSIGSLGSSARHPDMVKNIYVSNAKMINCSAVARIKFYPGGPSHGAVLVSNVTYKDIVIDNSDYAVQIDNCYETDPNICKQYPSAAELLDIHFINITGTTSQKYDPVVARLECPPNGTCDLTFQQWNVLAPSGRSSVICRYYEHPSGIVCA